MLLWQARGAWTAVPRRLVAKAHYVSPCSGHRPGTALPTNQVLSAIAVEQTSPLRLPFSRGNGRLSPYRWTTHPDVTCSASRLSRGKHRLMNDFQPSIRYGFGHVPRPAPPIATGRITRTNVQAASAPAAVRLSPSDVVSIGGSLPSTVHGGMLRACNPHRAVA